jgi:serine/threonine protein kinase
MGDENELADLMLDGPLLSSTSGGLDFDIHYQNSTSVHEAQHQQDMLPAAPQPVTCDTVTCVIQALGTFVRDPPLLNPFDRRACLGSGAFGTLIKAKRILHVNPSGESSYYDQHYALKCISTTARNIPVETIAREANILQGLNHPSIVQYVASCHDDTSHTFYVVMEFVDGMTLSKKIQCNPVPSEFEVFSWMKQIASALA